MEHYTCRYKLPVLTRIAGCKYVCFSAAIASHSLYRSNAASMSPCKAKIDAKSELIANAY